MSSENKFYQKWWFWAIIGFVVIGIFTGFSSDSSTSDFENLDSDVQDEIIKEELKNCLPNWECSDWSECLQSGVQTRTCSDANYCGTDEGKLPEIQDCIYQPKIWHEDVAVFSGTNDKTTDTFEIEGDKFRLTYFIRPDNEYDLFYVYVYPEGQSSYVGNAELDGVNSEGKIESTIIYDGPGTYYLEIVAANLKTWRVQVDDYY